MINHHLAKGFQNLAAASIIISFAWKLWVADTTLFKRKILPRTAILEEKELHETVTRWNLTVISSIFLNTNSPKSMKMYTQQKNSHVWLGTEYLRYFKAGCFLFQMDFLDQAGEGLYQLYFQFKSSFHSNWLFLNDQSLFGWLQRNVTRKIQTIFY